MPRSISTSGSPRKCSTAFAEQETQAFVTGNGTNKPKGFLDYTKVADASWSWGNLGYIATGAAGAFAASNPSDKLIDLVYALKAAIARMPLGDEPQDPERHPQAQGRGRAITCGSRRFRRRQVRR